MAKQTGRHVYVQEKHLNIAALVLGLVAATALGVTAWALFFRQTEPSLLAPDYAPQELERNAEELDEGEVEKLEAPSGGGAVTLIYQDVVTIDLSDETVSLLYGNPGESTMNIVLQIIIQDQLVAQSGRLEPGNQVTVLDMEDGAVARLEPGGYEGKFVVSFYDAETGEKSALNTEIPLTVTVTE